MNHRDHAGEVVSRERCGLLHPLHGQDGVARVSDHDRFERADGSTFLVGFVAAPILEQEEPTGLAVVFRDISEQKARESELAVYRAALDAVPAPVFWLARDASILYVNVAASDHLGYSREELCRMRVFDFDDEFPRETWGEHWQRVREEGVVTLGSTHTHHDGRKLRVVVKVQHIEHEGDEFHVAVVRRQE